MSKQDFLRFLHKSRCRFPMDSRRSVEESEAGKPPPGRHCNRKENRVAEKPDSKPEVRKARKHLLHLSLH
jgi:hypothetical protein